MEHTGRVRIPFYMVMTALIAATGAACCLDTIRELFQVLCSILSNRLQWETWTKELIVSAVVMGALIGALLSGRLVDHYGSQRMLRYMAVAFIIAPRFRVWHSQLPHLNCRTLANWCGDRCYLLFISLFISEMPKWHPLTCVVH